MKGLVSIIIPAFNAVEWLPDTLISASNQDLVEKEIIVIDDGSTDGTAEFVRDKWPQVRLVRTENKGASHARNVGAEMARGDLVQYLDADDLLLTGKISRQAQLLQKCGADLAYGNWQRLVWQDAENRFIPGETIRRRFEDVDPDPEIAFFTSMWCPTGAYLYRRQFLDRVLPWKEWLPVIQDARFAFDCAAASAVWCHDDCVGILYRQHSSGSVSSRDKKAFLQDCMANARDVEFRWRAGSGWAPARHAALLSTYSHLARTAYETDRPLFAELYAKLNELEPGYVPHGPLHLRWTSKLIGYERAEWIALHYRKLKLRRPSRARPAA